MGQTTLQQTIADRQREQRRAIGASVRDARHDAGLSIREVARAAAVDPSHLSRVEAGEGSLSQDALVAVAAAVGCHASVKLFQTDGPRLRDHLQARMIEAVLAAAHRRWRPRLEVSVYRPARGVIDLVLEDREHPDVVAGEAHSQLRSAETQLRWAAQKAESLPSAEGWPWSAGSPSRVPRLLLLRSCRAMHETVLAVPTLFRAAYPAHPAEAHAALTTTGPPWPGDTILWVTIDGADTRVIDGLPRAIRGTW